MRSRNVISVIIGPSPGACPNRCIPREQASRRGGAGGRIPAPGGRRSGSGIVPGRFALRVAAGLVAGALTVAPVRGDDMKPETLERMKHATVYVKTFLSERSQSDKLQGTGSGFFINNSGLLITNNHVVDPVHMKSPEEKHKFHYSGGKLSWKVVVDSGGADEKPYKAVVLYQNETADQAVLQTYDEADGMLRTPNYMRLLPESRLQKGMKVWGLGFPGGDRQARDGEKPEIQDESGNILSFPRTPGGRLRMVYTDVLARPGNSGGPMVDQDGFLVGTVTLMTAPEGREDTGGARYSSLVPAKLTGEMIRNAFALTKIPVGTDVAPFVEHLTEPGGLMNVPEFDRHADDDVLFFTDGDRVYGRILADMITWESELGKFDVPTSAIAYIMTNDDGSNLFLEGGNRLSAAKLGSEFPFVPAGGTEVSVPYAQVSVVAFRTADRGLAPVSGKTFTLDTDLCHLVLSEIEGTAKFASRLGTLELKLDDIERVDTNSTGKHVVVLTDDRRMTGKFEATPLNAKIAATGTLASLDLSKIRRASVEVRHLTGKTVGGLGLVGIVRDGNHELRKIAQILESDDPSGARAKLDKWLDSESFKKLPELEKDQVNLLDAVAKLRAGDQAGMDKAFRAAARSEDVNITAYATAAAELLKDHADFSHEGRPLSDRAAFADAGATLAAEYMSQTRDLLKDAKLLKGESKAEYVRAVSDVKKHEKLMTVAAVFYGTEAEDLLVRVWKVATDAALREHGRIEAEIQEAQGQRGSSGKGKRGAGQGSRRAQERTLSDLEERKQEARDTYITYLLKRYDYGFRVEDPDIAEMRAKKRERGGGGP